MNFFTCEMLTSLESSTCQEGEAEGSTAQTCPLCPPWVILLPDSSHPQPCSPSAQRAFGFLPSFVCKQLVRGLLSSYIPEWAAISPIALTEETRVLSPRTTHQSLLALLVTLHICMKKMSVCSPIHSMAQHLAACK